MKKTLTFGLFLLFGSSPFAKVIRLTNQQANQVINSEFKIISIDAKLKEGDLNCSKEKMVYTNSYFNLQGGQLPLEQSEDTAATSTYVLNSCENSFYQGLIINRSWVDNGKVSMRIKFFNKVGSHEGQFYIADQDILDISCLPKYSKKYDVLDFSELICESEDKESKVTFINVSPY